MYVARPAGGPSPLHVDATSVDGVLQLTLRGEADLSNRDRLEATLARVDVAGLRAVHLRLTYLTFCDVHAFGELLAFAQEARLHGVEVSTVDATSWVHLMASLLDVGGELGLPDPPPVSEQPELTATDLDVDGQFELRDAPCP